MKLFLNLSRFGERAKFGTWVYSVTYNHCIDIIRKRKKRTDVFDDNVEDPDAPIEEIPDRVLLEIEVSRLKVILEDIPPDDKIVLLMKYRDEIPIREIAETTGKSESAVKMKLKRAKEKALRAYRKRYDPLA